MSGVQVLLSIAVVEVYAHMCRTFLDNGSQSNPITKSIRCLRQLVLNHLESNPEAAQAILHDFYVKDFLSGADTQAEDIEVCNEVISILESGRFELRKWILNDPQVIQHIPSDNTDICNWQFGEKEQHKTLGLMWDCRDDVLIYKI
ncbi:hypothetical protein ILUMI_00690 [Ignelater luminosus]|uniref:Uncharacterized protein n=1 Tax=Ignelater luminosus TaxID=2038154 RepID=A0A8K0DS58_IGNLU|nr:hypothetical protein ILUMI_00690 [Ignelater luminosus]